jgi:hypothetical protein
MSAEGIARRERREQWADEMRLLLYDLAHDGEPDAVKVAAARALLDRIEGLPVTTTVIKANAGPRQSVVDLCATRSMRAH